MKSIAVDNDQLAIEPADNDGDTESSDGRLAISLHDDGSPNHHNQCVRVMIAVAIARGSLFDMLSIAKMLLRRKGSSARIYNVSKILTQLHQHVANLKPQS